MQQKYGQETKNSRRNNFLKTMKKRFWVDLRNFNKNFATAAIEAGADALLASEEHCSEIEALGKIEVFTEKDFGKKCDLVKITQKSDEDKVVSYSGKIPVIVENIDWTIIPLENLISKTSNLIQAVKNPKEARLALTTMERGADGIFLIPKNASEIKECGEIAREVGAEDFSLEPVKIIEISAVAMSDRCCIDTTSLLPPGVGILAGDSGRAMFLVHNENVESPFCAARPFRVNAGAVHAYVRLPGNRTKYLCELSAGDEVVAVDPKGNGRVVAVGRNKIERRPMLLVKAENASGKKVSLILQNAETIRLTTPQGKPSSVTRLKIGDEVLAFFGEETGRHFGEAIRETISEK